MGADEGDRSRAEGEHPREEESSRPSTRTWRMWVTVATAAVIGVVAIGLHAWAIFGVALVGLLVNSELFWRDRD